MKLALFSVLAAMGASFAAFWAADLVGRAKASRSAGTPSPHETVHPTPYAALVGVVTDFLDTLGIGSFATTASFYKIREAVPDRLIPGTLNVGHTFPTLAQAFIYIAIVRVEMNTLVSMIAAAVAGAWLCACPVPGRSQRRLQVSLGIGPLAGTPL